MRNRASGVRLPMGIVLAAAACGCTRAGKEGGASAPGEPPLPAAPKSSFDCVFADRTSGSGIRFTHVTGAFGEKLLPETMGSGAAFLDFDGDGRLDIFFVNSAWWPGHELPGAPAPASALYRGNGDGTFEDVTAASHAGITHYGMGAWPADPDGDGDEDILVTGAGGNRFLQNDAGVFHDATERSRLSGGTWKDRSGVEHAAWSTAAAWADVDQDGDLDVLVAGYVEWTPELEIFTTLDGVTKAFTTPDRYRAQPPRLYLNGGDGVFTDGTEAAGLGALEGKGLGISSWDFNQDGLLDFVIANDTRPNFLLLNRGGARFEEAGLVAGIAYDETGRARAGMGIDVGDWSNGGAPAVAIGNFSDEPLSFYVWDKAGLFRSEAARVGLAQETYPPLTFGVEFHDLDLDGIQDLVIVNGHIEPDIARFRPGQSHAQAAQVFRGRPGGTFDDVSAPAGPDLGRLRVGRGLAGGDVDGDGDVDLLITVNGGSPVLLMNERRAPDPNHYLRVRLRGKGKNTRAIGATVRLTAGGVTQTRLARSGSSYLSQSEATLTFGLGKAASVDNLHVRWPSGKEMKVPVDRVDRVLEVLED